MNTGKSLQLKSNDELVSVTLRGIGNVDNNSNHNILMCNLEVHERLTKM